MYSITVVTSKIASNQETASSTAALRIAANLESFCEELVKNVITVTTLAAYVFIFSVVAFRALFMLCCIGPWLCHEAWSRSEVFVRYRSRPPLLESPGNRPSHYKRRVIIAVALGFAYVTLWPYVAVLITASSVLCSIFRTASHRWCSRAKPASDGISERCVARNVLQVAEQRGP